MQFCRIWQQDLALCLTKAHRYLVEVYLEWSTMNHLGTHHKGELLQAQELLFPSSITAAT